MDCSTPGFPVLYCLQEFAEICIRWVGWLMPSNHSSSVAPFSSCKLWFTDWCTVRQLTPRSSVGAPLDKMVQRMVEALGPARGFWGWPKGRGEHFWVGCCFWGRIKRSGDLLGVTFSTGNNQTSGSVIGEKVVISHRGDCYGISQPHTLGRSNLFLNFADFIHLSFQPA